MNAEFYQNLSEQSLTNQRLEADMAVQLLNSSEVQLLPLLNAAFTVRKKFWQNRVTIHIINNAQNGNCPEDCHYCAQAKTSRADINEYPLKSDDEFLAEAKSAYEKGAYRYCLVFAGRGPSQKRVEHLAGLINRIKAQYPLEICVSAGLIDEKKAALLKTAGLDRLNHNLNTSERHYPNICTTHTYTDRINTLQAARKAGIQLCSGVIVGMKETSEDIVEVAYTLRRMNVESIPVNFYIPIEGNVLDASSALSPEYCLRILCLYRFLNPQAEIRIAAGREIHLRSMEVMALYPANSLFLDGYLNTKGAERARTLQMIKDAGFTIQSDQPLDGLIQKEPGNAPFADNNQPGRVFIKDINDLRPTNIQTSQAL